MEFWRCITASLLFPTSIWVPTDLYSFQSLFEFEKCILCALSNNQAIWISSLNLNIPEFLMLPKNLRRWDGKKATREAGGRGFESSWPYTRIYAWKIHVICGSQYFFHFSGWRVWYRWQRLVLNSPPVSTGANLAICPVLIIIFLTVIYRVHVLLGSFI